MADGQAIIIEDRMVFLIYIYFRSSVFFAVSMFFNLQHGTSICRRARDRRTSRRDHNRETKKEMAELHLGHIR